jgi:hypothetical protein
MAVPQVPQPGVDVAALEKLLVRPISWCAVSSSSSSSRTRADKSPIGPAARAGEEELGGFDSVGMQSAWKATVGTTFDQRPTGIIAPNRIAS